MSQLETISLMAAVIYATRATGKDIKPNDQQKFYDNAARQAWALYHAVGASQAHNMGG